MTDATSTDPTQMLSGMLSDPAATLFGLEDEFSVLSVQRTAPAAVSVVVEQMAREGPCPDCGILISDQGPAAETGEGPACLRAGGGAVVGPPARSHPPRRHHLDLVASRTRRGNPRP